MSPNCVKTDSANSINLKLFPDNEIPPDVKDHHVPVRVLELSCMGSSFHIIFCSWGTKT